MFFLFRILVIEGKRNISSKNKMDIVQFQDFLCFTTKIFDEASYYASCTDDAIKSEQILIVHTIAEIFSVSHGGESFETMGDTGFKENYMYTYDNLLEQYKEVNYDEKQWIRNLFLLLGKLSDCKLPPCYILWAYCKAALTDNVEGKFNEYCCVDDNEIYKNIQEEFKLDSLEITKSLVKKFGLDIYQWRDYVAMEDFGKLIGK